MKKYLSVFTFVLCVAQSATAKVIEVFFSHANQQFYTDATAATRWDREVAQDDTIELSIIDTPVGIYEIKLERINKADNSLSAALAKKLGLPDVGFIMAVPGGAADTRSATETYNALAASSAAFNDVLSQPSRYEREYDSHRVDFRRDFSRIITIAQVTPSTDLDAMTNVVHTSLGAGAPAKETIRKVLALARDLWTAGPLGNERLATYDADQEFDVIITWTVPAGSSVKTPPSQRMPVRFASNWIITSTVGMAASRLVDQNYTTRTITTPASGTTPEVTRKVAVREQDDHGSFDGTMFVHVTPTGDWIRRSYWRFLPRQLSLGIGIGATDASGRIYTGVSWPLGRSASITFGAAAGKTKVLSRNVNVDDLGDVDPQASRRDVLRFAPFIGFSWRIAGPANPK